MFHNVSSPSGNRENNKGGREGAFNENELRFICMRDLALFGSLKELCKSVSDENAPTKSVLKAICITLFLSFKR